MNEHDLILAIAVKAYATLAPGQNLTTAPVDTRGYMNDRVQRNLKAWKLENPGKDPSDHIDTITGLVVTDYARFDY